MIIHEQINMAHTTEDNRHPMEETEDSAGIRESFEKENTDEWTKGRQRESKKYKTRVREPT